MARRLFDLVLASAGLVLTAPIWLAAAVAIRVSSPGPILYRPRRAGRHGRPFTLFKLRTMHVSATGAPITGDDDPRVFRVGAWLRTSKIDELPQLVNVLRGEMSIVGPRPEDPAIVRLHYTEADRETLGVRPGLASPGSLYNYTHGQAWLTGDAVMSRYVSDLLPIKLKLDRVYVHEASLLYDIRIIVRTLAVLGARACGRRVFRDPPEMRLVRPGKGVPA